MEKQSVVNVSGFKANSNQIDFSNNHNLEVLLGACLIWLGNYDTKLLNRDNFNFTNPITAMDYVLEPTKNKQSDKSHRIINKLFFTLTSALRNHHQVITITKEQILPILHALNLFDGTMYGIYGKQSYFDTNTYKYINNCVDGMIRIRQDNKI